MSDRERLSALVEEMRTHASFAGMGGYTADYLRSCIEAWADGLDALLLPPSGEIRNEQAQYSGDLSGPFWRRVKRLPPDANRELYALGVALQNLEGQVLRALDNAEAERHERKKFQPLSGEAAPTQEPDQ